MRIIQKISSIVILILVTQSLFGQNDSLTLEHCRRLALKNNHDIKMAEANLATSTAIKKFAKTYYFPDFSINGGAMQAGKNISLLSEDKFLPVVPNEMRGNDGELNTDAVDPNTNPDLAESTFEEIINATDDQGNIIPGPNGNPIKVPSRDENGNPIFEKYTYLPKDAAEITEQRFFTAGVNMSQVVYSGGKIRKAYQAAKISEEIAQNKKDIKKSDILMDVEESYWRVISLKEKVKMAEQHHKMLETLVKDLKNYKEEGMITNNELLKAKVKKNDVELKVVKAKNGLKLSRMALNQMIGYPLDSTIHLKGTLDTSQFQVKSKEDLINMAMNKRPGLKALENGVHLTDKGVELMKSRFMPNISVMANYMFVNPNPYEGFANEFGGDWNIGVSVNIPLFNWGNRLHTLEAAKSKRREKKHKLAKTREKINMQVQKSLHKYNEGVKKERITRLSVKQAKENLEIVRDNFEEGMAKTQDLLKAQAAWREQKSKNIEARTQLKLKQTKLHKVAGSILDKYSQATGEEQNEQEKFFELNMFN